MQPFAHEAILTITPGGDLRGPGGAITLSLCGSWNHPPPCPLAPHQTDVESTGDGVRLRIVFACRPVDEPLVRRRIDEALARGRGCGPDGVEQTWSPVSSGPATLSPDERDLGERLAG